MKKFLILLLIPTLLFAQQIIKDLTVQDLKVVSTTKGSKPCPLMNQAQINAIVSPLSGQCVYNTTTNKLNVYNGALWKAAGGGVDSWATATIYAVGDLVIESNKIYKCLIAHTSGTFVTDLAALKWEEISGGVSDHSLLTNLQLAGAGVTYGHIDDQAQTIAGTKTFSSTINGSITGNAATVTTNANLTGDVTSIGNATTYNGVVPVAKGGTGQSTITSGDILYGSAANTISKLAIGTETKNLKVVGGQVAWAEEDRKNLLINPNFEDSTLSGWTCTVGTCTTTNTSGEFSEGLRAMKVALSAQAMNVSQSIATLTGSTKQYAVGVTYRVPSTMADFQICTLIAGAEKTCVPSNRLILDDTYQTIEIPEVITPGSTVGIKFKTTSSYTGNAYFDMAYIKQGIGTQNLALDNVYSAFSNSAGAVSLESKDFINGNCVNSPTGVYTCTFVSGIFTQAPICQVNNQTGATTANVQSTSATTLVYNMYNSSTSALRNDAGYITCQKSGNDYLASSASVYSQSSANYSRRAYTPTFTGLGTVTGVSCYESRDGEFNDIDCVATVGTPTGVEARVSLPGNLVSSPSINSPSLCGDAVKSQFSSADFRLSVLCQPSVSYIVFGTQTSTTTAAGSSIGSSLISAGSTIRIKARVPIAGWSNSSSIVGSFEGIEKCANDYECTDTFSAKISATTCAVSQQNIQWIASTSNAGGAGICGVTFNTFLKDGLGALSNPMNCHVGGNYNAGFNGNAVVYNNTSSGLTVETIENGNDTALDFFLTCTKTGVDYKPKTAKIASSIGVPTVPGIVGTSTGERIDTFSVSYGDSNLSTNCTGAGNCYIDQLGCAAGTTDQSCGVKNISWSSTGNFGMTWNKTYTKMRCTGSANTGSQIAPIEPITCNNCSSSTFRTFNTGPYAAIDSFGTIMCQGSY